ncbi:unnamed protein product, partial [Ectocarpus sp. 12 AP-2014]
MTWEWCMPRGVEKQHAQPGVVCFVIHRVLVRLSTPGIHAGPMQWLPFDGQKLSAETPREFDVFDVNKGQQSGLNNWPGLR